MLLIDGVKYELWTPPNEDEFERVVKEHTQEIFGEQSIYLDRKQKLKSLSGIGSIPDGYALILGDMPHWHIVEVELSSHPLDQHVVSQVSRFIAGIKNPNTQREIAVAMYAMYTEYTEITRDGFLRELLQLKVKQAIRAEEIYKFLADIISKPPVLTIIIEKDTQGLREILSTLAHPEIKVVEFQTFVRERVGLEVHAHLFEPLYKITEKKSERVSETSETITRIQREESGVPEIKVKITPASIKYGYIPFPKRNRLLFPGYDEPFTLVTDIGEITPHVTGARVGTQVGDLNAGNRIGKNLKPWYKKHRELQTGDEIIIKTIEPMKKYRLEIVK